MKNSKFLNKVGFYVLGLVALIVTLSIPEAIEAIFGLSAAGTGTLAMAGVVTTGPDTRESAKSLRPDSAEKPGHLANDVSTLVTMIKPDEAPVDTLLRKLDSDESADDIQVNFEEVAIRSREFTTSTELTGGSATETLKLTDTSNVVEGETLTVNAVSVSGKPLRLRVEQVINGTDVSVIAINNATVPTIPDATSVFRGAPGSGELEAQAPSITQYPDMRYNYVQRFMAQVEESYIRKKVSARSNFDFSDQNYLRLYDMRVSIEEAYVFGQKAKTASARKGEDIYYCDGIYHQIPEALSYTQGSGVSNNTWIDWTKEIFAGNAGAEDRFLCAGKDLMGEILKIPAIEKQLQNDRVEVVAGLKLQKVETSFGELFIMHHKLFDLQGMPEQGMVVDLTNIKRRTFQNLKSEKLKLKESGQKNVDARLISEMSCPEVRYLDTHKKIIAA